MADKGPGWEEVAQHLDWFVPWRYVERDQAWFAGAYGNVAANAVDRQLRDRAGAVAISDRRSGLSREMTFRALYEASGRLARWWRAAGVSPGMRVMLYGEASVDLLVAWLALARIGAVVVRSLATLDGLLVDRVRRTEASWIVASQDTALQVERLREANALSQRWLSAAPPGVVGAPTVTEVIEDAPGVLDAVAVEANAVGLLLYGDEWAPYAYAGLGSLVAGIGSLALALPAQSSRVALETDNGGLLDACYLTLLLWTLGRSVVWGDVRDDVPTMLSPEAALRRDPHPLRMLLASDAWRAASRANGGQRLLARPALGIYEVVGRSFPYAGSPGHDQARVERMEPDRPPAQPSWCAVLAGIDGVREVLALPAEGGWDVWMASDQGEQDLRDAVQAALEAEGVDAFRCIVVPDLPETVEGHLAMTTMAAIGRREPHLNLGHLKRPAAIPALVERLFGAPMMLG
ncbi:MAG: AMP-binding protein [Firmicutes bacterium]|nr:AMP-binding protein [Bacillota bacterium]